MYIFDNREICFQKDKKHTKWFVDLVFWLIGFEFLQILKSEMAKASLLYPMHFNGGN